MQQTMQPQIVKLLLRQPQPAPQPQVFISSRQQGPNDMYDKFLKRGMLEFASILDHTHDDEWIFQIKKIFKVYQCTDKHKVQLVVYMFHNVVEAWYRTVEQPMSRLRMMWHGPLSKRSSIRSSYYTMCGSKSKQSLNS